MFPRTVVTSSRWKSLSGAAFLGFLAIGGVARGMAHHSPGAVITGLVVLGIPAALLLKWGLTRRPALVIDEHGLTDGRSGRKVRWDEVDAIVVDTHQGAFGESHDLLLKLVRDAESRPRRFIMTNANNPDEIELNLGLLSLSWQEVVAAVEQASGRRAIRTQSAGFRSAAA